MSDSSPQQTDHGTTDLLTTPANGGRVYLEQESKMTTTNVAYIPDTAFEKLRLVVALNLANEILKDDNHPDATALAPFMARVDEIICLEQQLFPESIRGEKLPPDYFMMDECVFEVPAE